MSPTLIVVVALAYGGGEIEEPAERRCVSDTKGGVSNFTRDVIEEPAERRCVSDMYQDGVFVAQDGIEEPRRGVVSPTQGTEKLLSHLTNRRTSGEVRVSDAHASWTTWVDA